MATSIAVKDKVAIVTGAAGGLGKAIAEKLLKNGASVVIIDVNQERLVTAKSELSTHGPVLALQSDVTIEENVIGIFRDTVTKFGGVDILVNNAGIMDKFDPVGDLDKELWDRVLGVNLTAPYLMSKYAVQEMLRMENVNGKIVNIGSLAGTRGFRAGAAYTTTKHGIVGLTKNTAAFYTKKGIRCNAIMPGGMVTNISDSMATGMNEEGYAILESIMGVDSSSSDIADMADIALFLCSDSSKVLSGSIVAADKGLAAY